MFYFFEKFKLFFIPITVPLMLWNTLAFISGIIITHTNWHWLSLLPILLIIPLLSICYKENELTKITLWAFFFLCFGIANYSYHTQSATSFYAIKKVRLYGQVLSIQKIENRCFSYKTTLNVKKFKYEDVWFKNSFKIAIYTHEEPTCTIGSYITCGRFDIKPPSNEEFKLYLKKEGLSGTVFLKTLYYNDTQKSDFFLYKYIDSYKKNLWGKLKNKIPPLPFAFFSSLFLGNRAEVDNSLDPYKTSFKIWGITHCLSRSGMHLVIFIIFWSMLFNFLPLSFAIKDLILSFLLIIYYLLSWNSIPFTRSLSIYFLYKIASFFNLQHLSLHILCIVCISMLLYNPFYIFFLDFQLTFLLSFSLIWIAHILHQRKIFIFQNLALSL